MRRLLALTGFLLLTLLITWGALAAGKSPLKKGKNTPARIVYVDDDEQEPEEQDRSEAKKKREKVIRIRRPLVGPKGNPAAASLATATPQSSSGYRVPNVQLNDPSFDSFPSSIHFEPSIASQGTFAVCGFNDGGSDAPSPNPSFITNINGFSISKDAGASWQDQGKRNPTTGFTSFNGDPVLAAGVDGEFYYLSDGGKNNVSFSAMAVSRSTNGGRTWSTATSPSQGVPHRFPDGFFDKGWIAVDTSATATRGNIYVTWSGFSFSGGETDLYFARSSDKGRTWLSQRLDTFRQPVSVTYVQVAANGIVWVGEQDEGDIVDGHMSGTNFVRLSTDGGKSFTPPRRVGTYFAVGEERAVALCGDPSFFGGLVRYLNGPIEADSSLRMAVDPTDPTGLTAVVTTQGVPIDRPGDESDIFVWKTTDGGLTWKGPVRVNDDRTLRDQFMPDLWFAPDGTLGLLWLDRRNDPSNWTLEAWMALSHDGGETWDCNFPVSSAPFAPVGRCQMSDYNGVHASHDRFFLAWGDSRQVDSQRQVVSAIYGATVPIGGPGPLLFFAEPRAIRDGSGIHLDLGVRNDGLKSARDLSVEINEEGQPGPLATYPFPDVGGCHETVRTSIYLAGAGARSLLVVVRGEEGEIRSTVPVSVLGRQPQGTLLSTSFDGDWQRDWTVEPGSLWRVTSRCISNSSSAAYFGDDATCNYNVTPNARVFGSLVSRSIDLPMGVVRLTFREWVGLPSRWRSDQTGLQISMDGGKSFENLWGYARMSRHTLDPAIPLGNSGGLPDWHGVSIDLTPWAGKTIVLRFFFNGISRSSPGYAVDDVEVKELQAVIPSGAEGCSETPIDGTGPAPVPPL